MKFVLTVFFYFVYRQSQIEDSEKFYILRYVSVYFFLCIYSFGHILVLLI